jgi:hypothetical protein
MEIQLMEDAPHLYTSFGANKDVKWRGISIDYASIGLQRLCVCGERFPYSILL